VVSLLDIVSEGPFSDPRGSKGLKSFKASSYKTTSTISPRFYYI